MKRYESRRKEERQAQYGHTILDWEAGTAVYARQSTQNQRVRNVASAEMQTEKLLEFAYRNGAPQDSRTVLYDENISPNGRLRNASGTLRIDQREGLTALCERIERDEAKVVVTFMVDRLFRDEFLIGPGTFVKMCKEHDCKLVLHSGMVFDFSVDWHQQQFFMESLAAANYLKMMRERLHENKMFRSRQGYYDGRTISIGYMVDRATKRYVVYQPHADVVAWLFQRFYDLGADLGALCREVREINGGYLFPPFDVGLEQAYITKTSMGSRGKDRRWLPHSPKGFNVSREGVISILTNSDYVGDWRSEGDIVQVNNHDAIVERELYTFAYSNIVGAAKVTKPRQRRMVVSALLNGILTSPVGHVYVIDNTINGKRYQSYGACSLDRLIKHQYAFTVDVSELDEIVSTEFLLHIANTPDFDKWERQARRNEAVGRSTRLIEQIGQADQQLLALEAALDTLTDRDLIRKKEESYRRVKAIRADLVKELDAPQQQDSAAVVASFRDLLRKIRDEGKWEGLSLNKKQQLVKALTTSMDISQISSHWLQLDITWLDPEWGIERAYIYRRVGASPKWEREDRELLKAHYPTASRWELEQLFPNRNWNGLVVQAHRVKIQRGHRTTASSPIPNRNLTLKDWEFMQAVGIAMSEEDMSLSKVAYWSSLICMFQQRQITQQLVDHLQHILSVT